MTFLISRPKRAFILALLAAEFTGVAAGSETATTCPAEDARVEIPVLLWAGYTRPDGTRGYWNPQTVIGMGASLVNVLCEARDRPDRVIYGGALHPPKLLAEVMENCRPELAASHAKGIRVVGFANTVFFHPEMLQREGIDADDLYARDGKGDKVINRTWEKRGVYIACVNSPAWLTLQGQVVATIARGGFDAVQFDLHPYAIPPGYDCHCRHCAHGWEAYSRSVFGIAKPMPAADAEPRPPDFADPVARVYRQWRHEILAHFLKETDAAGKRINPQFAVTLNHSVDDPDYAILALAGVMPLPSCELWHLQLGDDSSLHAYRLTEALSGERLIGLINYPDQLKPEYRGRVAMAEAYAGGGVFYFSPGNRVCEEYARFLRENSKWFAGTQSEASVAVLHSWRDEEYQSSEPRAVVKVIATPRKARRAMALLAREQVSFDVVSIEKGLNAATLSRYRVVVASDLRLLSDQDAKLLKEYVEAGGRLLVIGKFGAVEDAGIKHVRREPMLLTSWTGQAPGKECRESLGAGKVAYVASAWDGDSEAKMVIPPETRAAEEWLEMDGQLRVQAATKVETAVRAKGDLRCIHLIRLGPADALSDKSVRLDYELPKGRKAESVMALSPDGEPKELAVSWREEHGRLRVTLDRLHNYALVGVRLAQARGSDE